MQDDPNGDLLLALQFFDGKLQIARNPEGHYNDPAEGLSSMRELTEEESNQSRLALARLLRQPVPPRDLLDRIAGVFAPDGDDLAAPRRADLKYRKGHRPQDHLQPSQFALEVAMRMQQGLRKEDAVAEVAQKYAVKESRIKSQLERHPDLWKRVRDIFDPQK